MSAYLDHAATTPMRPEATSAMLPYLGERFGNPTGTHAIGRAARMAVDDAREQIASVLGAEPNDIIFTSGGTEADNLALTGRRKKAAFGKLVDEGREGSGRGTLLCSAVEHHAVLRPAEGMHARLIPVDADGIVDLDALAAMLDASVRLISVMLVNNEIGVVQPLHKIRRLMEKRAPQAVLHTDAVQGVAWLDVARMTQLADMVSISAHKFGGPQGVGALIVRGSNGAEVLARSLGGGQERERRSGTHNVAGIVGMAAALAATVEHREEIIERVGQLRDRLVDTILTSIPDSFETGRRETKIAANAHLCFPGVESEALLVLLDEAGLYASAGASCSSGAMEPSHVLTAMGIDDHTAMSSLRLSLGYTTTDHDIELACKVLPDAVARLRANS